MASKLTAVKEAITDYLLSNSATDQEQKTAILEILSLTVRVTQALPETNAIAESASPVGKIDNVAESKEIAAPKESQKAEIKQSEILEPGAKVWAFYGAAYEGIVKEKNQQEQLYLVDFIDRTNSYRTTRWTCAFGFGIIEPSNIPKVGERVLATYHGKNPWIQGGWTDARVEALDMKNNRIFVCFQDGDSGWRSLEQVCPAPNGQA